MEFPANLYIEIIEALSDELGWGRLTFDTLL